MKKFFLKVLLFFACVVVMDYAFGQLFSFLRSHASGGSTANCEYIANYANEDIIILGSSRATHHYVPQVIEDSLGVSCYNCGEEGNGIVLAYGRFKMLTSRYKPKLILYEVTPRYDYGTIDPNTKYLGYLRAYYYKDEVQSIFKDFDDELSSVKMLSKMYQNTSRLLPNFYDNFVYRENEKGYSPLYGEMITPNDIREDKDVIDTIDSLKLNYIERMILEAKNEDVAICFLISPKYNKNDISNYEPAINICKKYSVPVYNYLNNPLFIDAGLFQDIDHLNEKGAIKYTQTIIKDVINNNLR